MWIAVCQKSAQKNGKTIDFYLSHTRSMEQARRFLGKAMKKQKSWDLPKTINTGKNAAYGDALESMKKSGKCEAV
ncbi:MAG: DDE-type integrase/transposase/recombinase [Candidatus Obscuribacter phosphatis]|uniref:DDE-type integrase/transposase/recombinase n=1 Tax=Candidatus Obscuribacter phosphatis TaxID=1906157 RepID=A0A8J7PDG7_9BACT|nr:DDE-type integrase/transposase/recombinase [Candidatus Obscuribacter phosphatis]